VSGGLVIGIDGGGSRSEARLWGDGREVARALGGALNPNHAGVAASRDALAALLSDLSIRKSLPAAPLCADTACIGLSGLSHPASRDIVQASFRTAGVTVGGARILVGDAELVLEAAFGGAGQGGVALIAGTGSIAVARDASGALVRAGGLGPERGDRGGGHWIGVRARAAGLLDGERPAGLAPAVVALARQGHPVASAILRDAAAELAALVREVAGRARLPRPAAFRPAGGLAAGAPELVALVAAELRGEACLGPLVTEPVVGALLIARRVAAEGRDVPPGW
jgi:N-acetylglucosamine kinase-like BadF-type ATPase